MYSRYNSAAGPRDTRERSTTIWSTGLVSISNCGCRVIEFLACQATDELAERSLTGSDGRPEVIEVAIIHADHQLIFRHVPKAFRDEGFLHFAGLHHRLEHVAVA
jgi:hypothetical protein